MAARASRASTASPSAQMGFPEDAQRRRRGTSRSRISSRGWPATSGVGAASLAAVSDVEAARPGVVALLPAPQPQTAVASASRRGSRRDRMAGSWDRRRPAAMHPRDEDRHPWPVAPRSCSAARAPLRSAERFSGGSSCQLSTFTRQKWIAVLPWSAKSTWTRRFSKTGGKLVLTDDAVTFKPYLRWAQADDRALGHPGGDALRRQTSAAALPSAQRRAARALDHTQALERIVVERCLRPRRCCPPDQRSAAA